ncbi:hypothetical protein LNJ05_00660 [Tenacibaculum finnmarkense genomovar ulcerans]|uniref:hypothetical protein n=1 Tax=Tenacibaculum finnmarkense TaxID=2781243 RepID=UPI001E2F8487|nr:hypothetical protein [Tenacibaculum finnmarkense]MCD8431276.1 hypothetical protein [Tenacibaculum finnmarkense genomovar ulcerans]
MEDLIKTIKSEIVALSKNTDTIKLIVLFSEGHTSFVTLVDNKEVDYEIGIETVLKINEYISNYRDDKNRLVITINKDKITETFDFDENYYILSNQGLLNLIIEKRKENSKIENEELIDLLSVAEYAITKTAIEKVILEECKLYLSIESCQLLTDILPNFIYNMDKYLFLCEISSDEIHESNLNEIIIQKIKNLYK